MSTYRIIDESPAADGIAPSAFDLAWGSEHGPTVIVTWDELAECNEVETMAEIAALEVGERTVLGMCDPIERVS